MSLNDPTPARNPIEELCKTALDLIKKRPVILIPDEQMRIISLVAEVRNMMMCRQRDHELESQRAIADAAKRFCTAELTGTPLKQMSKTERALWKAVYGAANLKGGDDEDRPTG